MLRWLEGTKAVIYLFIYFQGSPQRGCKFEREMSTSAFAAEMNLKSCLVELGLQVLLWLESSSVMRNNGVQWSAVILSFCAGFWVKTITSCALIE